ncbi:hypothetical protein EDC39_101465 [Geothermobacter ehrlichii]|uniref:Tetratricopeptide repeat protein n=1 Tax=Geothermobacter ehrlichii TaxID=213224 RepID=A0A5D3WR86_9BACT|nr:hypothetical protein [Geothermobacter ehrlichii]TYP00300.1 hypothetical protein EDC39_101465 [Geothermobacter ehrlichii]
MSRVFHFWLPPDNHRVRTGADQREVVLPAIPLPLLEPVAGIPSDQAIGEGLYACLRQNPDGDHAAAYARLLADAYPHYLADLAAQAVMIGGKEVDAPYLRRMINCLKILALIEPERADLQAQIGRGWFRLAFEFQELPSSRRHLLAALGALNRARSLGDRSASTLDSLARVNFLIGDYLVARQCWQELLAADGDESLAVRIRGQIERIDSWEVPDYPLMDDLEAMGQALELHGQKDFTAALQRLGEVEKRGGLLADFALPQFFHLAGLCHEGLGEDPRAEERYRQALEVDADFAPARERLAALERKRRRGAIDKGTSD